MELSIHLDGHGKGFNLAVWENQWNEKQPEREWFEVNNEAPILDRRRMWDECNYWMEVLRLQFEIRAREP